MTRPDPSPDHEAEALLERRADEALRRMIVPPSEERLAAIVARAIAEAGPSPAARPRRRFRQLALAAGLGAAVTGAWLIWAAIGPKRDAPGAYDTTWRSFETAYRDWTAGDFRPTWACRDEKEFAGTFRNTLHQGLVLKALPPDTEALGLVVCNSLSPRTTCLLARSGGQPVVVFVDRLERDGPMERPEGLNVFRREVGRLVLYEVSALDAPAVLGSFYDPDAERGENGR